MKAALGFAIFLVAYVVAGTIDYNDLVAASAERAQRPARDEARIWSKKCMKQGRQILATQADGGKWILRCVDANLKV